MRLKAALLGCGSFARRHTQVLGTLGDEVQLVAFSDRNEWKARAFSDEFSGGQARVFTHHHALLEEMSLDLLVVCLPPFGHSDEVERAAERGVHVFIEKPIALDMPHASRMVRAAEQAGIRTQVGFMSRFGEAVEQFKQRVDSGEAGAVGLFSARYFCNALHAPWWRDREKSGGQLVEQAIHLFDVLRFLMGDPVSVYSRQANFFHRDVPGYTAEDTSATLLNFASGAIGVVQATNGAVPQRWLSEFQVVAQHLTAEFASHSHATFHFTSQPNTPVHTIDSGDDVFVRQMSDLVRAIRTGSETRTPLREGARTLELVLAARRSAEEAREVRLD
ncbi:Gfo/Idh/MocA family protein [Deinococcus peraridilitoris]|uniref:Putative dehydrogenase n=1 Tax=Deinococcus peraridilitoris (strain DSM 19664 / LMG 22246 / CIP 109416 / KR-200) TaxID=937777 RepID=K9ZZ38_DEIPD|nr:Gfo/Idh/MocA family oxidoreductase [Deinococcus peraridilitoris]AFZ66913.1 putative dehydrogenase [Deinococcus peraridilitoris DSM 19664]